MTTHETGPGGTTGDDAHGETGGRRRMPRRRAILIGVGALLLVVVAAGAILYTVATRTTAASTDDAIADFRAEPGADAPDARGLPAPGVYPYAVDGEETIGGGPLSVSRDLPSRSPRIVRRTDDGFEIEWRLSGDHVESWGYRLADDGAHATFERSTLEVAGISATTESRWTPPPLRLPADPEVGMRWTEDAADGDQRIRIESAVTDARTVDVGGTPVDVVLIESGIDYSGPVEGRIDDTSYYDPETGLEVRHVSRATLDDGSSEVTTRWDARLRSMTPTT